MQDILDYLKNSGERLDSEIAAATGISIANVRQRVTALQARGAVMLCRSIRYQDGKEIEGILCRPPVRRAFFAYANHRSASPAMSR